MDKKIVFIALALVILLAGGLGYAMLTKEDKENVEKEVVPTEDFENNSEEDIDEGEQQEEGKVPDEEYFTCEIDGEEVDYTQNINIDTPVETETRVSGIASNGSNVKLILRVKESGQYSASKDFGMSYQPKMEEYDYNKIYSPLMDSEISLQLIEFSDERISAEFSGVLYDGNNNSINLTNCKLAVQREIN